MLERSEVSDFIICWYWLAGIRIRLAVKQSKATGNILFALYEPNCLVVLVRLLIVQFGLRFAVPGGTYRCE